MFNIHIYIYIKINQRKKTKNQLTFWLGLSTLSFSIAISTSYFFTFQLINLQENHHRENYKLTELAAKLEELMLNHKDSDDNNFWKCSDLKN